MANAVNSDKYKKKIQDIIPIFQEKNLKDSSEIRFSNTYSIIIDDYAANIGDYCHKGSYCRFYKDDNILKEWHCVDNSAAFYQIITHQNGKDYLIFRQDLYGYSVLDIENKVIMRFFPEYSLNIGETFIWTKVNYNLENNVLAVSGCYWSCPDSVQLFNFENPMNESPKFVDIISCLDGDYDVYDELIFLKWKNGNLHLKAYLVEGKTVELVITKEQYMGWLSDDKLAKYL